MQQEVVCFCKDMICLVQVCELRLRIKQRGKNRTFTYHYVSHNRYRNMYTDNTGITRTEAIWWKWAQIFPPSCIALLYVNYGGGTRLSKMRSHADIKPSGRVSPSSPSPDKILRHA